MDFEIRQGNSLDVMRSIVSGTVQTVITSPPYWGLRDYGTATWEGGNPECDHEPDDEWIRDNFLASSGLSSGTDGIPQTQRAAARVRWYAQTPGMCPQCGATKTDQQMGLEETPQLYIERMVELFREIKRVLRDDGTLWLNMGDSYASVFPRIAFGNQSSRGAGASEGDRSITRDWSGWNLAGKQLVGMPWRLAFALQADGWFLRMDCIWHKPNPMPESVDDRPTKSHEYLFLLSKKPHYFYDAVAIYEPTTGNAHARGDSNGPKGDTITDNEPLRPKHNKSFAAAISGTGKHAGNFAKECKEAWVPGQGYKQHRADRKPTFTGDTRNKRSVWSIPSEGFAEAHFATFPQALVEPCILAGTSPRACEVCGAPWERIVEDSPAYAAFKAAETARKNGGMRSNDQESLGLTRGTSNQSVSAERVTIGWKPTCDDKNEGTGRCLVMDPFTGSGTVAVVALRFGRRFIGAELNPEYVAMAKRRIAGPLFAAE